MNDPTEQVTGFDPGLRNQYFSPADGEILTGWSGATGRGVEPTSDPPLHGHTGSVLIPVYLSLPGRGTVRALLKYSPTGAVSPTEPAGHHDARQASPPGFARNHLVELVDGVDPVVLTNGGAVMFLEIVGGGFAITTLHAQFTHERKLSTALRTVVRSVLKDWNPEPRLVLVDLAALFADHLAEDIRPGDTFHRWVSRYPGLREATWLELPGVAAPVPNPLGLLDGRVGEGMKIRMHVGNAHGDLHLGNVILPVGASGTLVGRYRLIDLATFRADAPLARDPMFLLCSALLVHLPELGPAARRAALAMLVEPAQVNRTDLTNELGGCISNVWNGGLDWACDRGLTEEWRVESLLSLASAALRHVPWAADRVDRLWFFQLACRATAELLRAARCDDAPAAGQVVPLVDITGPDLVSPPRWRPGPAAGPQTASPRTSRLTRTQVDRLIDAVVAVPALRRPLAWKRVARRLPPVENVDGTLQVQVSALVKRLNMEWRVDRWQRLLDALKDEIGNDHETAGVELVLRLFGLIQPKRPRPDEA
jgi:hypothetical protein